MPQLRDQFVADWASGKFLNATELLKESWSNENDSASTETVDPRRIVPILRYGVFALPFIIEQLQQRNSPILFAAFLNIAGEQELYTSFIEKPSDLLSARTEKLEFVRAWVDQNATRMDKLERLSIKIRILTSR
jgi:hypothetical protein